MTEKTGRGDTGVAGLPVPYKTCVAIRLWNAALAHWSRRNSGLPYRPSQRRICLIATQVYSSCVIRHSEQAVPGGGGDGRRPGRESELGQHIRDVAMDGVLADREMCGDLLIAPAERE